MLLALVVHVSVTLAALWVLVTAGLLARGYRPEAPWSPLVDPTPSAGVRRSVDLVRWHELGLRALLAASILAVVCTAIVVLRRDVRGGQALVQLLAVVVASAGAVMASLAWPMIEWQQVALRAVTVGGERGGLWFAAFGDGILFVIVDGREVPQSWVAAWLVVHLVGVAVAAVAGLVGATALVRTVRATPG